MALSKRLNRFAFSMHGAPDAEDPKYGVSIGDIGQRGLCQFACAMIQSSRAYIDVRPKIGDQDWKVGTCKVSGKKRWES
ncbi:uncharacterized protein N7483_006294 [Penicillium malachiteum]|uniref:uncharacterized protein n=1 Tax=Penicillium malachiteum TaxID=1324776 RepID=UPI002547E50E|nr:uncharacterized protein N7483_006294 [Penicillium malachiteum]KAJ5731786.1 hypothetical protein N7483_006294 [Penicillium malachiteum]